MIIAADITLYVLSVVEKLQERDYTIPFLVSF
jgi:hypothetical protein